MKLVGSSSEVAGTGQQALPGRTNHFSGNDPTQWQTGLPAYARVEYPNVYPGIDLVYYGTQRQLEYDFVVAAGAQPSDIGFVIEGAQRIEIDDDGNLLMATSQGVLTQRTPILYQEANGSRRLVDGGFVMKPNAQIGFRVGEYDDRLPLIIDPVLSYSTYLGGANQERIHGVGVDSTGNIILVGETYSDNFPTADAWQPQRAGFGDAFVAKLNPTGNVLLYATYIGGTMHESAHAVGVDAAGAVYVIGSTSSWDFPTLNPIQAERKGYSDAFVLKLNAAGELVYSTLLGGSLEDYGNGIAVDATGRAHVAGSTWSGDFPIANALQPTLGGYPVFRTTDGGTTWNGQTTGLRTAGVTALVIDPTSPHTVYAGTRSEGVFKTVDGSATWTETGLQFPSCEVFALAVANPVGAPPVLYAATSFGLHRSQDGGQTWTALLATSVVTTLAIDPADSSTLYAGGYGVLKSTDSGDTWTPTGLDDQVIAMSASGQTVYAATANGVFVSTAGSNWVAANAGLSSQPNSIVADPTNGSIAYVGTFDGLYKTTSSGAFWEPVWMLSGLPIYRVTVAPSAPSTVFAAVMSGGLAVSNDAGETWRLTHSESASVLSIAVHPSVATTIYMGAMMSSDGFVASLNPDGSILEYSTYFGGSSHDEVTDIALDADRASYVVGTTFSTDLPLFTPLQPAFGGLRDVFAARITAQGSLGYSTYLGGWGTEFAPRVAVDAAGQAHVTGVTFSTNYPVANAYQPQAGGGFSDVFLSVLNHAGTAFLYSTYLGGSDQETDASYGPDVAVTANGETYVSGTTLSMNFPISPDAFQRVHAGGRGDAFVTRFNAAGGLDYSTFLGGAGSDYPLNIAADAQDGIIVTGYTTSSNFPLKDALQPANAGTDDGFVVRFGAGTATPDMLPPMTTIVLSGTLGQAGWYRSQVVVTLTASDGESGSGVQGIQYRLNGGALQSYTAPFTIAAAGLTQLTAQSTDAAGNVENPAPTASVRIDATAPLVSVASPVARQYLYTQIVPVTVSASDSTSGLPGPATLTLDGAPFSGTSLSFSTLALGPHVFVATAIDRAGNASQVTVPFEVVTQVDSVINVPADAPTIQAAIDRAMDGETVLVARGTYRETIDFRGKAIAVMSEEGPELTIIDAAGAGSVVSFRSAETRASELTGFTIRGGLSTHSGGGISIVGSSPTIRGNTVTENRSCSGVGIYSSFGSPVIKDNKIVRNTIQGCTGGWGIGIYIGGNSAAEVIDNEIAENTGGAASGGGLALFAAGNAVVTGNVIARNVTNGPGGCGWGGGIAAANFTQAKLVNNVIVSNVACTAGGIYWISSSGNNVFVNNTIADNVASASYAGVYLNSFNSNMQLHNNIVTATSGPALYCQTGASFPVPTLNANDLFTAEGSPYGGSCSDKTGVDGNISASPQFVNAAAADYRLRFDSPAIDVGNPSAPNLPATDLSGNPRVFDGDGDGTARVDLGAVEFSNRVPVANAGADQNVVAGADCRAQVPLVGSGSDADGHTLTFTWTGSFGTVSGASATVTLPAGSHVITLTVDDGNGGRASDTVVMTVRDVTAPTISSLTANPSVLQRDSRELVPVALSVSVADGCAGAVTCRIVSVTSNEPPQRNAADWEITGDLTLKLRADRSNKGTGRVYTITVECTDASGNKATSLVTVTVPK